MIKTKKWVFNKIFDKFGLNKKFCEYSESEINIDKKLIVSPCDSKIANLWKINEKWSFISKWWKEAFLWEILWDEINDFKNNKYINFYLSPKNRHFFTMPYDWKIEKIYKNDWKAIIPLCIWIENFLNIEVFHKAIIKNATLSYVISTEIWKLLVIAVWSLNVNHIASKCSEWDSLKKWDMLWHFSLWSSVIMIYPEKYTDIKKDLDDVVIWEWVVEI